MTSGMDERPAQFGCSLKELRELMEHRGHEGYQKIQNDYNGVLEICKRLYTSPNEGKRKTLTFLVVVAVKLHFRLYLNDRTCRLDM